MSVGGSAGAGVGALGGHREWMKVRALPGTYPTGAAPITDRALGLPTSSLPGRRLHGRPGPKPLPAQHHPVRGGPKMRDFHSRI